jgi:hypothetical protein
MFLLGSGGLLMTINAHTMFQDNRITHGEAVSLIVDARKRFAGPGNVATTDRATLVAAVKARLEEDKVSSPQAQSAAEKVVDKWLNSSSIKGRKGDDADLVFKDGDITFPVFEAPAKSGKGTGLTATATAEAAVAKDGARTKLWTVDEIKANPAGFLKHATQLDGSGKTTNDQSACGPSAMLFAMVAKDPEALVALAKLVKAKAGQDPMFIKFQSFGDKARLQAIENIAAGKYSAADVQALAVGLYEGFPRTDGGAGLNPLQMGVFVARLHNAGATIPPVELHMYTPAKKGEASHWMAPTSYGMIDTWPNAKGENPLHQGDMITAGSKRLEGGLESKVFIHDGGNIVGMNQYKFGDEKTATDPPLAHARYDRQADGKYSLATFNTTLKTSPFEDFKAYGPSGL